MKWNIKILLLYLVLKVQNIKRKAKINVKEFNCKHLVYIFFLLITITNRAKHLVYILFREKVKKKKEGKKGKKKQTKRKTINPRELDAPEVHFSQPKRSINDWQYQILISQFIFLLFLIAVSVKSSYLTHQSITFKD